MHTCCTWILLYATPTHLPSICPFTRPYVLISAQSMYLPPVLWAWIHAPATHFLGARILTTSSTSTPPAAFSALPQHLPSPFSVIVLSSQYLFQRGLSGLISSLQGLNSGQACEKVASDTGLGCCFCRVHIVFSYNSAATAEKVTIIETIIP